MADLNTRGDHRIFRGGGARDAAGLVDQVFKIRPDLFVPGGIHIGQVIGNRIDVELLSSHPGSGGPQ